MGYEHVRTIYDNMSEKDRDKWAKVFVDAKHRHLHEINDAIIFKGVDNFGVVNKSSLFFRFFYEEKHAINYVLDNYGASKSGEQTELKL